MNRNPAGILFVIALFSCHNHFGADVTPSQNNGNSASHENTRAGMNTAPTAADTLKSSVEYYTRRIKENPSDGDALWNLAKLELKMNKPAAAITEVKKAIKLDSTKAEYYSCIAEAYFLTGNVVDSKNTYHKCIQLNPNNTDNILKLAELHFDLKENAAAIEWINKAIRINPRLAKAYFLKGMIYLDITNKDTSKALSSFQTATEQDPEDFDAFIQLGLIYSDRHSPLALDYFNDAMNIHPRNVEPYYDKGMFYQRTGDFDNAIKSYNQLLEIDSLQKFALYNLGVLYLSEEDYNKAAGLFSKVVAVDSTYYFAWYGLGTCDEHARNRNRALADYAHAVRIKPGFKEAEQRRKALAK